MRTFFWISVFGFWFVSSYFLCADLVESASNTKFIVKQTSEKNFSKKKKSTTTSQNILSTSKDKQNSSVKIPIFFKGKNMVALRNEGSVELHQDVVVSHGNITITADYSKLFFSEKERRVEKIYAKGHVSLHKKDKESGVTISGYGEEAVYTLIDNEVVLKKNVKLIRGKDTIDADYLSYNLAKEIVYADGAVGVVKPENNKR